MKKLFALLLLCGLAVQTFGYNITGDCASKGPKYACGTTPNCHPCPTKTKPDHDSPLKGWEAEVKPVSSGLGPVSIPIKKVKVTTKEGEFVY